MAQQLTLWDDVRVPNEYHAFFLSTGTCLNCRMKLRHPLHAFNHFKKFHRKPPQRFFVWSGSRFSEVKFSAFMRARRDGKAVAYTKN